MTGGGGRARNFSAGFSVSFDATATGNGRIAWSDGTVQQGGSPTPSPAPGYSTSSVAGCTRTGRHARIGVGGIHSRHAISLDARVSAPYLEARDVACLITIRSAPSRWSFARQGARSERSAIRPPYRARGLERLGGTAQPAQPRTSVHDDPLYPPRCVAHAAALAVVFSACAICTSH